jgi:putative ABC transport system ATP-binding protein
MVSGPLSVKRVWKGYWRGGQRRFGRHGVAMVSGPLSVKGAWKGYWRGGQWTAVLDDVSLELEPGEIVAITGSRFEGKTMLLKIAAGMELPDKGSVWLGNRELTGLRDRQRSRMLGHQILWIDRDGPGLKVEVSKYVGWPIALHGGGRRQAERDAAQILERVGAKECLGRCWGELSNWQCVLVGLARAFAGNPRLAVIDDLLDALGGPATEEASDLLRSLVEESEPRCGVLMSVSDVESAMFADRVWSITAKRSLKPMSGQPTEGDVVPLRKRADP